MIKITENNEKPKEKIIPICGSCNKEFSQKFINKKIEKVVNRIKWANDIELKNDLTIYTECSSSRKKVKMAELIFEYTTEISLEFTV